MRLIDVDKLRKDIIDMPDCYNGYSDKYDKAMIVDMIDEQPSVDAVPVIRCEDCKYNLRNPRRWNDDDEVYTYIQCKFMNPDDYCSFAKPKETETT